MIPAHHATHAFSLRLAILLISIILAACAGPQPPPYEEGSISVHFCPQDCNSTLHALARTAETLDCAFYDLDPDAFPRIPTAKILIFEDNYQDTGTPIGSRSLMHNKFCILSERLTWTGSMNPTYNGIFRNNNNLILINSSCITRNYRAEYLELQDGHERALPCPTVNLSGTLIHTYFCPEDDCHGALLTALQEATRSIHFMTFSFTLNEAADLLITKHREGLNITGIFEKRQQSHSIHQKLADAGITLYWDKNPATMHHKTFIIDEKTVITGSMNPTKNGVGRNDENLLIINDERIARAFLSELHTIPREPLTPTAHTR
ncbi:MAG: hypothetical protein HC945_01475 [Nitrosarchaeum sp.]|nr:hypothetical protein [Nitrosarchaeum sp.]